MRKNYLWLILLAGLLVRLWVMRWPPFPIDMQDWIAWGERVLRVGPPNFYDPSVFSDYAPGYLYVMLLTAAIKHALLPNAGLGTYYFLYRIVPVLCDLVTGGLIFNVVANAMQRSKFSSDDRAPLNVPALAAALHVFNPAIIFNSAIWGQIDATFTLGMLLSLVFVLRDKPSAAVVSYVIALLIKPQAISLAPLLAIVLLMRYSPRRWIMAGLTGLAVSYVLMVPFLGFNAFVALVELLTGSVNTYPYTSMFTYNVWGIYGMWRDNTVAWGPWLTLRSLGTLLYLVGIVYGAVLLWRKLRRSNNDTSTIFCFAVYFTFLPVMVLTRMHERYLYPVLPLLLIWVFVYGIGASDRQSIVTIIRSLPFVLYVILTMLHTLNLYQVYTYYLFRKDEQPVPQSYTLYYFIDSHTKWWSAITLAIFVVIVILATRLSRQRLPAAASRQTELA